MSGEKRNHARHRHPTREHIVRWLKPSAESFAAAAAVCSPDLMLQLAATAGAVPGPPSPECGGRSHELGPRRTARFECERLRVGGCS